MFTHLNSVEKQIIDMFLDIDFSWKKTLINQIANSRILRSFCNSSYFVDFVVSAACDPIDTNLSVPLAIVVDHQSLDYNSVTYEQYQNITFSADSSTSPTGFNLHFRKGYLVELEVYSLGGDVLKLEQSCIGSRSYFLLFK